MADLKNFKPGSQGNESEVDWDMIAEIMTTKGDAFGDDVISMMALDKVDRVKLGILTVGLAKALATLKGVALKAGFRIDRFYEAELCYYENGAEALDYLFS